MLYVAKEPICAREKSEKYMIDSPKEESVYSCAAIIRFKEYITCYYLLIFVLYFISIYWVVLFSDDPDQ